MICRLFCLFDLYKIRIALPIARIRRDVIPYPVEIILFPQDALVVIPLPQSAVEWLPVQFLNPVNVFVGRHGLEPLNDTA